MGAEPGVGAEPCMWVQGPVWVQSPRVGAEPGVGAEPRVLVQSLAHERRAVGPYPRILAGHGQEWTNICAIVKSPLQVWCREQCLHVQGPQEEKAEQMNEGQVALSVARGGAGSTQADCTQPTSWVRTARSNQAAQPSPDGAVLSPRSQPEAVGTAHLVWFPNARPHMAHPHVACPSPTCTCLCTRQLGHLVAWFSWHRREPAADI